MTHQDGFFKGIRNAGIYFQNWRPESDPKAVLILVHGLAEHCGRYMNLVNHFVPLGYAVYGFDHVGHGKSDGARVHVKRFEDFTETLHMFLEKVRQEQPGKPHFLVGHSMGALISAAYLLDYSPDLSGAVLSGPGVKVPDTITPTTIFLGKLFSNVMPRLGLIGLDPEWVSRDPDVVAAYVNDPLVYTGKTTARLAAELLKTMHRVCAEASRITLPLLIIQGGDDRLVDPAGARLLYDFVSSTDKTIQVYDGLYHEIFNEPEHQEVLADVETWLASHLDS